MALRRAGDDTLHEPWRTDEPEPGASSRRRRAARRVVGPARRPGARRAAARFRNRRAGRRGARVRHRQGRPRRRGSDGRRLRDRGPGQEGQDRGVPRGRRDRSRAGHGIGSAAGGLGAPPVPAALRSQLLDAHGHHEGSGRRDRAGARQPGSFRPRRGGDLQPARRADPGGFHSGSCPARACDHDARPRRDAGADARHLEHRLRPRRAALGPRDRPASKRRHEPVSDRHVAANGAQRPGLLQTTGRRLPRQHGAAREDARLGPGPQAAGAALRGLRLVGHGWGSGTGIAGGLGGGGERPHLGGPDRPLLRRLRGS